MTAPRGGDAALSAADLAIADAALSSIAEEMGEALGRTAFSPNIKERRDFSCAVFDPAGAMVAQAAHIPVHLGSMPASVRAVMGLAPFAPGDVCAVNDPFLGGTHLPDVTMVSPIFADSPEPIGFVASRAHQADIGGMAPGSMPVAEELIQEGLIIPPIRLYRASALVEETMELIVRNVRTPDERRGDFAAQIAAQRLGEARTAALQQQLGPAQWPRMTDALLDYGERLARSALQDLPRGAWQFEDALDDDGRSPEPVPIRLELTVNRDGLHFDFSGSAPQRPASVNAVAPVARSACYYVLRCLLPPDSPMNAGVFRPVSFTLPPRSIVAAQPPVAVAAGNVETSQRIVDAVWGAFAQILPDRMPAASSGTMNNLTAGGTDPRDGRPWAYYETSGGGLGAGPEGPGLDAAHSHMTNTLNTPAEALELAYPLRVLENSIRPASGGQGKHRGGHGLRRRTQFLAPARVTIISERRRNSPWGAQGGSNGKPGRNSLETTAPSGKRSRKTLPGKVQLDVQPGDVITLDTPGAGGWGIPPR